MITETDTDYMQLALSLAERGRGTTSPNPMVGAVIVRDGVIVGQGYHVRAGQDHAEVVALREAGVRAEGATLYVTMEPCCHHGKTPPCSEAVIRSGIARVVAAMTDPNPKVCGGGFASLARNGIEYEVGILEDEARRLNETYIKYIRTGLPFLTLKLAMTLDGKIAARDGSSKWITGPEARRRVHLLRSWSDAVMVGSGTVREDNPRLTVRDAEGRDPLRVVLDSRLHTPLDAHVFDDSRAIAVTLSGADREKAAELRERGIEVWETGDGKVGVSLSEVLAGLGARQVTSVLCEGGGTLAGSLLREKLVDKVHLFIAPKILGGGIDAIGDTGIGSIGEAIPLRDREMELIGDDLLLTGYPEYR
jgi:diaminohydroxyphosphoribosylaminopyrimidine deaminase/5-amino-6-(5-phosphoribosylamino)uracil reductase